MALLVVTGSDDEGITETAILVQSLVIDLQQFIGTEILCAQNSRFTYIRNFMCV